MRHHGKRRPAAWATLGLVAALGVAGGGVALAQKPPAQPAPAPAPTTKPPALGAPQQPAPPRVATPAPAPAPGKPPAGGQAPQPPVAAAPPPPPQPIPANEPAGITSLRQLLGNSQLSYATAEVVDPATGRARMTGVVIVDSASRTTAEEVIVEQAGREGARYARIRNLQAQTGNDRFAIAEVEVQNLVVRQSAGAMPGPDSFDVERFTLRDGRLDGEVQMVLGSVLLEGWGQGRPARIEVAGFEIGGPPRNAPFDRLRIGRMMMGGMDFAGTIAAAIAGRPPTYTAGEPVFEAEDLAATMQGAPVAAIASIGARSRMDATGSGTGTIAIRGVRVLPVAGIAEWMQRYGYPEIRAELTMDSRYDAQSGRVEISSFRIAGQDIGTLTLSLIMDGLTQDATMRQDYGKMRLFGMSLGWLDQSILQRAVRDMAQSMRTTEAALRDQWAGMASGLLAQRGAPGLDSLRDAIVRYIRGQASEITIRAEPPQPVPFTRLQGLGSPAQAQQVLGLSATAR